MKKAAKKSADDELKLAKERFNKAEELIISRNLNIKKVLNWTF